MSVVHKLSRSLEARFGVSGTAAHRFERAAARVASPQRERLLFVSHQLQLSSKDSQRISDAALEQACTYLLSVFPETRGARLTQLFIGLVRLLGRTAALLLALLSVQQELGFLLFFLYVAALSLRPFAYRSLHPFWVVVLSCAFFGGLYWLGYLEFMFTLPLAALLLYYSLEP